MIQSKQLKQGVRTIESVGVQSYKEISAFVDFLIALAVPYELNTTHAPACQVRSVLKYNQVTFEEKTVELRREKVLVK